MAKIHLHIARSHPYMVKLDSQRTTLHLDSYTRLYIAMLDPHMEPLNPPRATLETCISTLYSHMTSIYFFF